MKEKTIFVCLFSVCKWTYKDDLPQKEDKK